MVWTALCWVASLLWAALKLPWRVIEAISCWYEAPDDELAANLRQLVLTLAHVAGGAMLVLNSPSWLVDVMPPMPPLTIETDTSTQTGPPPEAFPPAPSCLPARVTAERVNLRAEPGRQAKVLRKLLAGEVLIVLNCRGHELDGFTWWEVLCEDGVQGWAATRWLEQVQKEAIIR